MSGLLCMDRPSSSQSASLSTLTCCHSPGACCSAFEGALSSWHPQAVIYVWSSQHAAGLWQVQCREHLLWCASMWLKLCADLLLACLVLYYLHMPFPCIQCVIG